MGNPNENPELIENFCSDGIKDAIPDFLKLSGYSIENPNPNGNVLNKIFNMIFEQLNHQKSKGFSFWQDDKAYYATANNIDIVRENNIIYFAKQDSNTDPVASPLPKAPSTNPDFWGVLYDLDNPLSEKRTGYKNLLVNTELRVNQLGYANALVLANNYTYDMFIATVDNSGISSTGLITGVMAQFIEEQNIVSGNYTFSNADCDITIDGVTKSTPCTFDITVTGNVEIQFSNGNLKNIQMELGKISTNKELRHVSIELDLCLSHLQFNYSNSIKLWLSGNTTLGLSVALVKFMRITPVLEISNILYTNASSLSVTPSKNYLSVSYIGTSDTGGSRVSFNYIADARIYY